MSEEEQRCKIHNIELTWSKEYKEWECVQCIYDDEQYNRAVQEIDERRFRII